MAQDTGTIHITFRGNVRGSSPFPFYVENTRGTAVTTNLETGGTLTQKFTGTGHDHTIVDNGDGTITITIYNSGQNRIYDQFGNLVFHDAGSFRFSFDLDYQGTPGDPRDDTEVPDTFQIVREPTGRDDTSGRNFCEDLLGFTTPSTDGRAPRMGPARSTRVTSCPTDHVGDGESPSAVGRSLTPSERCDD